MEKRKAPGMRELHSIDEYTFNPKAHQDSIERLKAALKEDNQPEEQIIGILGEFWNEVQVEMSDEDQEIEEKELEKRFKVKVDNFIKEISARNYTEPISDSDFVKQATRQLLTLGHDKEEIKSLFRSLIFQAGEEIKKETNDSLPAKDYLSATQKRAAEKISKYILTAAGERDAQPPRTFLEDVTGKTRPKKPIKIH